TLPFKCADEVMCDGIVEGNHVLVLVERDASDSRVSMFWIVYEESETLTVPQQPVPAIPITLAQALKRHSMQEGASAPKLGYAKGRDGMIVGIADIDNRIAYQGDVKQLV